MMLPTKGNSPEGAGACPAARPAAESPLPEARPADAAVSRLLPPVKPQPGAVYVPSCFVLSFEHRGKRYAYNTLTKQCLETALPASAKAGEGFDALIRRRFLVPENLDECATYSGLSSLMRAFALKKGVQSYTILPTLACNARCVYCYQEGMAQRSMSPEAVEQAVSLIRATHGGDRVKLDWFGGEPLLRPDVIDRVCAALREDGCGYVSTMISNGSLITPGIVEKMTGEWRLQTIQISMDGAEEDYIARKRYVSGQGHFLRVMEAMSAMSAAGIRVGIRCNVDEENWSRIPRFLEELRRGVSSKENVGVYFCPLNAVRTGPDDAAMWQRILEARPLVEAAGFKAAAFMEPGPSFRVTHCMADGGGVVIAPDGTLYACEHCAPESRVGDLERGLTGEEAGKAFRRADRIREKCRRCPFLPECTSFACCPVEDTHCREVRGMMTLDYLRRVLDGKENLENGAEEPLNC